MLSHKKFGGETVAYPLEIPKAHGRNESREAGRSRDGRSSTHNATSMNVSDWYFLNAAPVDDTPGLSFSQWYPFVLSEYLSYVIVSHRYTQVTDATLIAHLPISTKTVINVRLVELLVVEYCINIEHDHGKLVILESVLDALHHFAWRGAVLQLEVGLGLPKQCVDVFVCRAYVVAAHIRVGAEDVLLVTVRNVRKRCLSPVTRDPIKLNAHV